MLLDKDRDAVFVVAGGYKIGGGAGGVAAVCHGHAHAGVSHHAGVVVRIAKHADVLELHVVELRHAHEAARLGHARIHELVEPLRGLQSRRLNGVVDERRRPLNHPRHYLGRCGKHHLGLRLAQKLGKIDHLVGHAVDARQVLDARVALGHVEHAVSGADGRCRKVRHVLADARDGLARQRIAQLVDAVRTVDDLGAATAHQHVYQAFDAPAPWTSEEVIAHTHGFTAFIDGHSHTVMANKQVTDASGKAVTLTQTGSYFKNIGKMTVGADGTITTELINTYEGLDAAVAATASNWISAVDDMLGEEIAVGDQKFYINDPATGKRRIRSGETNLGDFVADGIYTYFNEIEELHCDVAIMNGGGIRTDVEAGPWSFKTCKTVSPFGNVACLMSVTGQQIQDALEFGARFAGAEGKENGGFLQVAGARYTIHPMIPNTVQTDDKNVWTGSAATPRVSNVEIYDKTTGTYKPLDPNATYALAGMNYTLRNLGDGFAMFDGATLIKDYVSEDYLVMSSYAAMFGGVDANGLPHLASANSPLADYPGYLLNYEDPYGAGRIQMIW